MSLPTIQASETSVRSYVDYDYIVIDGNSDFASQASAEGWNGSGTADDPYVISCYEIYYEEEGEGFGAVRDASTGISISNTNVYFIIEGNYVYNFSNAGIMLSNVINGIIRDNLITYNDIGIQIDADSDGIVIENNTCEHNDYISINVDGSNSTVIGNNCSHNNGGIGVSGNNNMIKENKIDYAGIGIGISGLNTKVYSNEMNYTGILLFSSDKLPSRIRLLCKTYPPITL